MTKIASLNSFFFSYYNFYLKEFARNFSPEEESVSVSECECEHEREGEIEGEGGGEGMVVDEAIPQKKETFSIKLKSFK